MPRQMIGSTPRRGRTCPWASAGDTTLQLYFRHRNISPIANLLQQILIGMSANRSRPTDISHEKVQDAPPLRIRECLYKTSTIVEVKPFLFQIHTGEKLVALAASDLSVGEVARRAGVPISTLHFYEAQGLIESQRTRGNQRRYHRSVLRLIAVIKVAQRVGIPLGQIRDNIEHLPSGHVRSAADWAVLSTDWRMELDRRIALLMRLRDQLDSCIGCGCLSLSDCPLRNPGDVAGGEGPGARAFD